MDTNITKKLLDTEKLYRDLSEIADSRGIDNGFFIDAVYNVINAIKEQCNLGNVDNETILKDLESLEGLHDRLMEFREIYQRYF